MPTRPTNQKKNRRPYSLLLGYDNIDNIQSFVYHSHTRNSYHYNKLGYSDQPVIMRSPFYRQPYIGTLFVISELPDLLRGPMGFVGGKDGELMCCLSPGSGRSCRTLDPDGDATMDETS
jgi:hypothetical protein